MSSHTPILEWQIILEDSEWRRQESLDDLLQRARSQAHPSQPRLALPFWLGIVSMGVSLTVLISGACVWYFASLGAERIDQEVLSVVGAETWSQIAGNDAAARSFVDREADARWQSGFVRELGQSQRLAGKLATNSGVEITGVSLRTGMAMAEATVTGTIESPYRELRFYREDPSEGWLRTAPDAGFWGSQQTLDTAYFHVSFRSKDAAVVMSAAPQLDPIYAQLRRDVGLPPDPRKLTVVVSPLSLYQLPYLAFQDETLVVPSPYLLQTPLSLSHEDVLLKSVVNPLVAQVTGEAPFLSSAPAEWQPVAKGLVLWEAYVGSDSLAPWYRQALTWIYQDVQNSHHVRAQQAGNDTSLLCREYRIWRYALPRSSVHPRLCHGSLWQSQLSTLNQAPKQLDDLQGFSYPGPSQTMPWTREWVQALAASGLVDYVVATYGRERLPDLVAGFDTHRDWTALAPAVFGVSAQELERGWQTYLDEQYGGQR